tara:strand:- start:796 stop:1167 length:372 start_codon:yes stop_codon:yes gene_type:complete
MNILGFTDEITSCDCCGRTELKGTYVMDDKEGNIYYYGSSCGVNAASLTDSKELKKEVKKADFVNSYSNLKSDHNKIKAMKSAINKGLFSKDQYFEKFGELQHKSKWATFYTIGHITHEILFN